MKFLDKFRNKYSFNFLAICGWIIFNLFCIFTCPEIYITYIIGNTEHSFGIGVTFLIIFFLALLFYLITFFVYFFETIGLKKITNEKFLNNRYIKAIQNLGIIFAFLPLIVLVPVLIIGFTKDLIYSVFKIGINF